MKYIDELFKKCDVIRKELEELLNNKKMGIFDEFWSDFLEKKPLAPFIGVICNQQISAEVAWKIPETLSQELDRNFGISDFRASDIASLKPEDLKDLLEKAIKNAKKQINKTNPSRKIRASVKNDWLNSISGYILSACEKIANEFNDEPDRVFIDDEIVKRYRSGKELKLPVPVIYMTMRQFAGVGEKKASMVARDFAANCNKWLESINKRLKENPPKDVTISKISVVCENLSEIPPDVHVNGVLQRVFRNLLRYNGYRKKNTKVVPDLDIQNIAKIVYPENPGLVDVLIWKIGRDYCTGRKVPDCKNCPLAKICDSRMSS